MGFLSNYRAEYKGQRARAELLALAKTVLEQRGVRPPQTPDKGSRMRVLADTLSDLAGLPPVIEGTAFSRPVFRLQRALHELGAYDRISPLVAEPENFIGLVPAEQARKFYESFDWRRLRFKTIKRYGRVCMCCGTTKGEMHVDHIKPVRKYWELRLDPDNLQVLCDECNHGKGNWDETDFRDQG